MILIRDAKKLPRRTIKVDGVFDIETHAMTQYVCGGYFTRKSGYRAFGPGEEIEIIRRMVESGACIWAHFGGGFDFKWLLDWIVLLYPNKRVDLFVANSRIILLKIGGTRFYDSFAIAPMNLKKFSKGLGVEKQELLLPCDCVRNLSDGRQLPVYCGGFCSIAVDMPGGLYRRLLEYMEYDCRSLMAALDALQGFAENHDLDLGATIGSSAWRNAKRFHGLPDTDWTDAEYDYLRGALFGGRVSLLRHGLIDTAHHYDVVSMYPGQLAALKLPTGQRHSVSGAEAKRAYAAGKEGIFTASVEVPESFLPPLPVKHLKGSVKAIAYPTGKFIGSWSALELRAAEEDGTTVEILRGIYWEESEVIFREWVDNIFSIRAQYGRDSGLGTFAKLYPNSYVGKNGAKPDRHEYSMNGDVRSCTCSCIVCHGSSTECGCPTGPVVIKCHCGSSYMLGSFVTATPYRSIDACAHIHHNIYVCSAGRVQWRRFAQKNGAENSIYGDTDSLTTTAPFAGTSNTIGHWQHEGRVRNFEGIAPKCYSYELSGGPCPDCGLDDKGEPIVHAKRDKQVAKAKGIEPPKHHKKWPPTYDLSTGEILTPATENAEGGRLLEPLAPGHTYEKTIVSGFRSGASKDKFFRTEILARRLSRRMGDRVMVDKEAGTTRPKTIEEVQSEGKILGANDIK